MTTHINLTVGRAVGLPAHAFCDPMPFQKGQAAKTEAAEKAASAPAPAEYRQPTQREQLEYALVSGAAIRLAHEPNTASAIAEGIKTVLDSLHSAPALNSPHAGTSRDPVTSDLSAFSAEEISRGKDHIGIVLTKLPVLDPGADSLERQIQAKASAAPRVTPADIENEIAAEFYFTAADGVLGQSEMGTRPAAWTNLDQVTICTLVLRNGAKVLGVNYGAIDRAEHDAGKGREAARAAAVDKVWELLGFRLRDKLAGQGA